jgi:hypothetical protein
MLGFAERFPAPAERLLGCARDFRSLSRSDAVAILRNVHLLRIAVAAALFVSLVACGGSGWTGLSAESTTSAPGGPVAPLPFNASGLLAGSAEPSFPDGEPNKVSVVQIGPMDEPSGGSAELPFAFRNNTSQGISHIDWTATARRAGSIIATGSSQGTIPAQVQPGEVGLAFIFLRGDLEVQPADAEYQFTVKTSPANQSSYNTAPLKVTEANASRNGVVGSAVNGTGKSVAGPFSVSVYCFQGDKLLGQHGGFAEQDGPIAAGGQVTFTVDLSGSAVCPTFAVGVDGYFEK